MNISNTSCFSYVKCSGTTDYYKPCFMNSTHPERRYSDSSASWILNAAIIVFFMKAGFMLMEIAFARNPKEKRYVVVLKHQDAFASAFGFFFIGYDAISRYVNTTSIGFFKVTDPLMWFFKFTFASNAATIVGGCLVTNKYKLRIPAAFISAFVISGIIHPVVARIIWSDQCDFSLSPYRFCNFLNNSLLQDNHTCSWNCSDTDVSFTKKMYVLDFAGGGAVHLIGGVAGLVICLFAKFQEWRDERTTHEILHSPAEVPEEIQPEGFWDWMYPVHGGEETVSEAALGVLILWFCWFSFNCGSAESVETGTTVHDRGYPFYGVPATIAINMIMAGASGGTVAILIAVWAQVRYRTESVNANEIANGVLSALVSISAGCAFVDYWGAVLIGSLGVIFYHCGCYLEYLFKIKDTARVVPVHGVCGLWGVLATGLFMMGPVSVCNLHAAFEGLCYCDLRLPILSHRERIGAQMIGALIMIAVGLVGSFITYFILYIIPIGPFVWLFDSRKEEDGSYKRLVYKGGWLLTHPCEEFGQMSSIYSEDTYNNTSTGDLSTATPSAVAAGVTAARHIMSPSSGRGSKETRRSSCDDTNNYGSTEDGDSRVPSVSASTYGAASMTYRGGSRLPTVHDQSDSSGGTSEHVL